MIIRIFTGIFRIFRRTEDMSENLNTETMNNIAEIKDSVNEIRNMLIVMKSRIEEAGEQIRDPKDRLMESNQAEQNNYTKRE